MPLYTPQGGTENSVLVFRVFVPRRVLVPQMVLEGVNKCLEIMRQLLIAPRPMNGYHQEQHSEP